MSRTLEESGRIKVTPPARYCYVVARFVLLEDIRKGRRDVPFEETRSGIHHARTVVTATDDGVDQSLDCLNQCLDRLKPEDRFLIVEWTTGTRSDSESTGVETWPGSSGSA